MFIEKLMKKSFKLAATLAFAGVLTLGLSGLALADAPAADTYVKKSGKGINYPAYLYAKGQRGEATYKNYVKPAKGYKFYEMVPLASHNHVSEW